MTLKWGEGGGVKLLAMTLIFQKQFRHAPLDLESNVLFEKLSQEKMSSEKAHKLFMQVSCPTCIDTILEQF